MKNILFVCIENSNRSQMAEAFVKIHNPSPSLPKGERERKEKIIAFSAGSKPSGKINPKAIEAMKMIGYDLYAHKSKSVDEVLKALSFGEGRGEAFDYVITMGCGDDCPFIHAKHREDWDIPDPKNLPMNEFVKVRDLIERKVKELIKRIATDFAD